MRLYRRHLFISQIYFKKHLLLLTCYSNNTIHHTRNTVTLLLIHDFNTMLAESKTIAIPDDVVAIVLTAGARATVEATK